MQKDLKQVRDNISQVIMGKNEVIELLLIALLAKGHVLFDDVPGVGKTRMAASLARSLGVDFSRVQFTPDLQPADITGLYYYNQKEDEFKLRLGPAHTNILLADEINRAVPRTQASLMEVMEERQITIEGKTHQLQEPFLVVATQNPVELEGTFPLPEAQLDRFLFRLQVGYPELEAEKEILRSYRQQDPFFELEKVMSREKILSLQQQVQEVSVNEPIIDYITRLVRKTRNDERIKLGLSPRATLALMAAARARALLYQRDYVIPDDVQAIFPWTAAHRLLLKDEVSVRGIEADDIIEEVVAEVEVPVEGKGGQNLSAQTS